MVGQRPSRSFAHSGQAPAPHYRTGRATLRQAQGRPFTGSGQAFHRIQLLSNRATGVCAGVIGTTNGDCPPVLA